MSTCETKSPVDRRDIVEALVTVAEQSFFAYAELAGDDAAGVLRHGEEPAYEAVVAFGGPFEGRMRVAVPAALARELASAFSGASTGEGLPEQDVVDLVGEFANMVAGCWLSRQPATSCFTLEAPRVRRAELVDVPFGAVVNVNDRPVGLRWDVGPGRREAAA
jgi:hypothetical protein